MARPGTHAVKRRPAASTIKHRCPHREAAGHLDRSRYLPQPLVANTRSADYAMAGGIAMAQAPRMMLDHHLKRLKLRTFLLEYEKLARQYTAEPPGSCPVPRPNCFVHGTPIDRERRFVEAADQPRPGSLSSQQLESEST